MIRHHPKGDKEVGRRIAARAVRPYTGGAMSEPMEMELVYGRKAVRDLLLTNPHRVHRLTVATSAHGPVIREVISSARAAGIPVHMAPRQVLDRKARHAVHQGLLAEIHAVTTVALEDLLAGLDVGAQPLLVACDGVTDPHNLGAIARTAACVGAAGLLVPARESAPLSGTVHKVAAGALEHLPVARVGNLGRALDACRHAGYWIVGTAADADTPVFQADLARPSVVVLGREDKGLRPGVRRVCDMLVAIPLAAGMDSLNVSVAAGVVLYEAWRQRWAARSGHPASSAKGSSSAPAAS